MLTDLKNFRRCLRRRGETISRLAAKCCCGRAHVSQVFNGHRPGGPTRRKLRGLLTLGEQWDLGWERELLWPHEKIYEINTTENKTEPCPGV